MKCSKCKGRKVIEILGGVIVKRCPECKGKGEIDEEMALDRANNPLLYGVDAYIPPEAVESIEIPKELENLLDDITRGIEQDDKPVRVRNTRKPRKKYKTRKVSTA